MDLVVPSPCETEPYNNGKYTTDKTQTKPQLGNLVPRAFHPGLRWCIFHVRKFLNNLRKSSKRGRESSENRRKLRYEDVSVHNVRLVKYVLYTRLKG